MRTLDFKKAQMTVERCIFISCCGNEIEAEESGAGEEMRALCNFKDAGWYELKYYTHVLSSPKQMVSEMMWYMQAKSKSLEKWEISEKPQINKKWSFPWSDSQWIRYYAIWCLICLVFGCQFVCVSLFTLHENWYTFNEKQKMGVL